MIDAAKNLEAKTNMETLIQGIQWASNQEISKSISAFYKGEMATVIDTLEEELVSNLGTHWNEFRS